MVVASPESGGLVGLGMLRSSKAASVDIMNRPRRQASQKHEGGCAVHGSGETLGSISVR